MEDNNYIEFKNPDHPFPNVSEANILRQYEYYDFNANKVAKHFNLAVGHIRKIVRESGELQDKIKAERDARRRVAEGKLFELVLGGDLRAIMFFLDRTDRQVENEEMKEGKIRIDNRAETTEVIQVIRQRYRGTANLKDFM